MTDATTIIAAWSAETFISRSIESALAQQDLSVAVVVVDDASPDQTEQVVSAYPGVIYEKLPVNQGPSAARNAAMDLATSDWIAVLDSDDTLAPTCLKDMIALADRTGADIVLGNIASVDGTGQAVPDARPPLATTGLVEGAPLSLMQYLRENQFNTSSGQIGYLKPVFRKTSIDRMQLRYDETLRNSEDFHIILRAIALGAKVVVSEAETYFYTVRSGSISHRVAPELFAALIAADDAFLQEFAPQLDAASKRLLKTRRADLVGLMETERIMSHLKARRFAKAIGILATKPKVIPYFLRQMTEAVGKRLGA